jgi:hypothetical protein
MAVYKIFASADASIYSSKPALNAGLDEILEVSVKNSQNPLNYFVESVPTEPLLNDDIRRSIVLFDNNDIESLRQFRIGSYTANLKLYLANAENLNTSYSLQIAQVHDSWVMGTGKAADNPETRNGVCWYSTGSFTTPNNNWQYYDFGATGSYYLTPGGGSWEGTVCSQSFGYKDSKDVNVTVTNILDDWFSGFANYGFIVKHDPSIEQNPNSYIGLSFFSSDTHTIYPPTLEMKWDDSSYNTDNLSIIDNSNSIITLANNNGNYKYGTAKYKVIINARDKYPVRTFTTSSFYTTNKALPQTSYWAIQDAKTDDIVIDFDTDYTKISCDGTNSYFNLYMNGLEPERYYKVLIRIVLPDGESYDIDNDLIFKVVR